MANTRCLDNLPENQLGGTSLVQPGQIQQLFQCRPQGNALIPEMLTVCIQPLNGTVGVAVYGITGTLTWGAGGANYSATFDLNQGVTFSVMANYLTVSASNPILNPNPNPPIQVSASVGYGTIAFNSAPLRLTVPVTGAGAAPNTLGPTGGASATGTIPIPPFAIAFNVQSVPSPPGAPPVPAAFTGPLTANQLDNNGNPITANTVTSGDTASNLFENTIPIIGNPQALAITNGNASAVQCSVVFVLSL